MTKQLNEFAGWECEYTTIDIVGGPWGHNRDVGSNPISLRISIFNLRSAIVCEMSHYVPKLCTGGNQSIPVDTL
jgi:hypothetical protein